MAAARKKWRLPVTLVVTGLLAPPLLVAPPVIRGLAASAWVSHYAELSALPRPRRAVVRELVEKTRVAAMNLAPLPQASATAIRTLSIGERAWREEEDRDSALAIFRGVREVCRRVRERPFSGAGFAVIEARAAALEDAAARTGPATGAK